MAPFQYLLNLGQTPIGRVASHHVRVSVAQPCQAASQPKSGTGTVEMIRHLKIARDTAVKARTQAMQTGF
jgi:hypothetical protein